MASLYRFDGHHPISFSVKQEGNSKNLWRIQGLRLIANSQGQAVVEYVLLLVVTVSLILGLRGVFTSMNTFMSDYMGEYIVCLMEYGELPTLGVQDSDLKRHSEGDGKRCSFQKFSAASSFTNTTGSTSSSSGSGSGSTGLTKTIPGARSEGNKNVNNTSKQSSANQTSNKSSRDSDTSSGSSSGRSGRSSPYSRGDISRAGSSSTLDAPKAAGAGKVKVIDENLTGNGKQNSASETSRSNQRRGGYQNGKYKAITGNMAEEIEKKSKAISRQPSSKLLTDEGYRLVPNKRTFTPPEKAAAAVEKPDEGFQFGNFMKWLIIAGIVIACFILFGGQIMNYSNSDGG